MNEKESIAGVASATADVAGLSTPRPERPLTGRQKLILVGLVILKRVRFSADPAGRRDVHRLLGHDQELLGQVDPAAKCRGARVGRGARVLLPDAPASHADDLRPNGDVPTCPICGMPLSVRKKGEKVELPVGVTGRVQISPERIQLAGIKTAAVGYRPLARQLVTVGNIEYDESRLSRIVSRVGGYVEKLYIDTTFAAVRQGQPLADIYSPELYAAAQDLRLAVKLGSQPELAESARKKLLPLGVDRREIDAIASSDQASAARLVLRSPQAGTVIEKKIVAGFERGNGRDALGGCRPVESLGRGRRLREGHRAAGGRAED